MDIFSLDICKLKSEDKREIKREQLIYELGEYIKLTSDFYFSIMEQLEFIDLISLYCSYTKFQVSQLISLLFYRDEIKINDLGNFYIKILQKSNNSQLIEEDIEEFIRKIELSIGHEQIMGEIIMNRLLG